MSLRKETATRGAEGSVAVTVALVMTLLLLVTALAIDLGMTRLDVRANQRAADLAVTAGALTLDPADVNAHESACSRAWLYFLENLPDADPTSPSPCATFNDAVFSCSPSTPVPATAASGPYIVTVVMPVPDDHALMGGQNANPVVDGADPCARLGMTVERSRDYVFATVAGLFSGNGVADAVARHADTGHPEDFASLVVLDRTECHALHSDGQGRITVESFTDGSEVFEGYIAVDSAASGVNCSDVAGNTGDQAIDVTNNNSCAVSPCGVFASGEIFSFGIQEGNIGAAFDSCDVDLGSGLSCNGKPILLEPEPVAGNRVTRKIIDHRYNCRSSYPAYDAGLAPQYPVEAINVCTSGSPRPHIDDLIDAYGEAGTPPGFTDVTTSGPLSDCTLQGAPESEVTVTESRPYFPCSPLTVKTKLVLDDIEGAVFEGGIRLQSGGVFVSNEAAASDHVLFLRSGSIERGGDSTFEVRRGMVYLHDPAATVTTAGGSGGGVTLIAPVGPQDVPACEYVSGTPPPAQCFEDLALWSNGSTSHDLSGQGSLDVHGTVFTPNAGRAGTFFTLRGQGNQVLDHAQFIAHRIFVTGTGTITMRPDPDRTTPFESSGGGLIR